MHSGISRRGLFRGVIAVTGLASVGSLAGCDLFGGSSDEDQLSPELATLLTQTVALGDAYDAAIARVPSLADRLTPGRDAHRAHAQALAQALAQPVPTGVVAAVEPSADTEPAVIAQLVEAEARGLEEARAACLNAPNRLAPLIGSIAAARACHVEVLS